MRETENAEDHSLTAESPVAKIFIGGMIRNS